MRTLIPAVLKPLACLFLKSVTVAIGLSPAFSAKVDGMTSNASANALKDDNFCINLKCPTRRPLPHAISLDTGERLSVLGQLVGQLNFGSTTSGDDEPVTIIWHSILKSLCDKPVLPLLDKAPNNTESIVQRAISLLKHQFVTSANDDRDGFPDILDSGDLQIKQVYQ